MQTNQSLADLDAIDPPTPANEAGSFSDLRTNTVRPHIQVAAPQKMMHKTIAREIRQRMDAAQNSLDFFASAPAPATPADKTIQESGLKDSNSQKRAYSQMLDVLKRACGVSCCPGEPLETLT